MSGAALHWAFRQRGVTATQKLVLLRLADVSSWQGYVPYLRRRRIATDCALSERSVSSAITALLGLGLVERLYRYEPSGRQLTSAYRLVLETTHDPAGELHDDDHDDAQHDPAAEAFAGLANTANTALPALDDGGEGVSRGGKSFPHGGEGVSPSGGKELPACILTYVPYLNSLHTPVLGEQPCEHEQTQKVDLTKPDRLKSATPEQSSGMERFDEFWAAYPKKVAKKECRARWKKIGADRIADTLIGDVRARLARCEKWRRGYVPNPHTYLNGERWNDDIEGATHETNRRASQVPYGGEAEHARAERDAYLRAKHDPESRRR